MLLITTLYVVVLPATSVVVELFLVMARLVAIGNA